MRQFLAGCIYAYQRILSPDTGLPKKLGFVRSPVCRFLPTCSEYTRQAILKHGVLCGIKLGAKRMSQCVPGKPPEYDPVP